MLSRPISHANIPGPTAIWASKWNRSWGTSPNPSLPRSGCCSPPSARCSWWGCVNLANLLLALATGREAEFAIRAALAATHARLVRQAFVEILLPGIGGAALEISGADFLLRLLIPLLPPGLPRVEEIAIHPPVMLFTIGLSIAGAFAVSIAPALRVSQASSAAPRRTGARTIF